MKHNLEPDGVACLSAKIFLVIFLSLITPAMSEQGITIEERTDLEYRTDRLLEQHKIPEHTFSPSKKSVTPKEKRKSKKQKKGKQRREIDFFRND